MSITKRNRIIALSLALILSLTACFGIISYYYPDLTNTPGISGAKTPVGTPTPILTPTDQLTLALNATGVPAQTMLGTNIQTSTEVSPPDALPAKPVLGILQSWNKPLVRLHFGFRSEAVITLPEATQGSWDFSRLDPVIATLRARNIGFYLDVRTAPPWMFDAVGQLPDQQFPAFATYMARLVGWYNKGGFTDDKGVFHASGHTNWIHIWEIWNEPKSAADIPVNVPDRAMPIWMEGPRFGHLYDMTTTAMRAVDPTIMTGGPALGSWPDENNFWIRGFIENEHMPVDFLSFHYYAARYPTEPDAPLFTSVRGDRFEDRLIANRALLDQKFPGQHIPIWITELNIDENSGLPYDLRGTQPIEYAFLADAFITAEHHGVGLIDQFNIVSSPQYGLIDYKTFEIFRPAWYYQVLSQEFQPGSTLLPLQEDVAHGVVALAAISPDGHSLRLLIGNIQVGNPQDVNGKGIPKVIRIVLNGSYQQQSISPQASATMWRFDATTPELGMPTSLKDKVIALGNGSTAIQVTLAGYGSAIYDIPLTAPQK